MDLLERARPLDELGRLTLEAASGAGRLVLVGGEAGVGKTSLVRQFTRALPGKVRALWGGCDPLSLPRPLGPLVDVAPALGPAFERLLEAEVPRARLFAAVRDALQAAMHILVFEDVHWADDATLDLLRYLGRRMDTTRSLVIGTYRDDEVGPKHPLRVLLGDLATADCVRRVGLEPLSAEGVRTLAKGSGLDPQALHGRTGGNPFFVTEVLAAGGASLPPTLRDAVLARAARLTPPARHALEAATVLGPRFDPVLLGEIASVDEAAAQYGRALRFANGLRPAERALLFEQRSYECYLTNQIAEAVAARREALELWREVGVPVKVGDSYRWLSRLSWFLGRNADAEAFAREALAVLEPIGPGPPLAWAYSNLAQIHMLAGRAGGAVEWGERAIAVAEDLGDREVLCHALNNVGTARSHVEDDDAGIALVERSLAIALELGFEEHVARAYTNLGASTVSMRRLPAARRHLRAGIDYCTEYDLDSWRWRRAPGSCSAPRRSGPRGRRRPGWRATSTRRAPRSRRRSSWRWPARTPG